MNRPCKIQCGNAPDYECETCHHRNEDYPMPGTVKATRLCKAKYPNSDVIVFLKDDGSSENIDRLMVDLSKCNNRLANYWEHWEPINVDTHPVGTVN